MKYCEKCRVSVRGDRARCPLCNAVLHGDPEPSGFPSLPDESKRRRLWISIAALASVTVCVVCLLLNYLNRKGGFWSLPVVCGVVCAWLMLGIALFKKQNIPKTLMWEVFAASVLSIVWDHQIGWRGWSINYVIPVVCMGAMVTLVVLSLVGHLHPQSLIVYLLTDLLLGIVQTVLLFTGWVTALLPSVLCVGVSAVTLAAMLIFHGRQVWEELQRRLHM